MKPFILLFATSALVAPLAAQNEGPGNDLIDLFEKSQREGASDEELMRMLENKTLLELQGPEIREASPEELQHEKDAVFDVIRRFKGRIEPGEPDRANGDATPRPGSDRALRNTPPRWLVGLVVEPLDPALRAHFDLPEGTGVIVESVLRGGPAAQAGIKANDIIITANERKVSSLEELKGVVEKSGSDGKAVHLEVIQRGKRSVVKVTPRGPDAPAGSAKKDGPMPSTRPLIEIQRRLEAQQQEIDKLRREVRELRERIDRE